MNKQAPELSPEARRIISDAQGADDPTADDQVRVKTRWLASVAAVAGVSSLTEAARAAGGIGWGLKAAGTALVVAAGVLGLYVTVPSGGVPSNGLPSDGLPSDARRDTLDADEHAAAPVQRGAARFEKTPTGGQRALERTAKGGGYPPTAELVSAPSAWPGGASPAVASPATLAPGAVAAPALPMISALPGPVVEAAPPAPSVLEPAEVPMHEGNALDVGVDAPATEATAARPTLEAREETAAVAVRESKAAQRQRVTARAVAPRAVAARTARSQATPPRANAAREVPRVEQRAAEPPAAAAAPSGQLGEELALLSEVRGSVQKGAGGRALELLSRYRSQFGRPILGMEADALKVDALCKAGQRDLAQASARAFQIDWPGSPLQRRVSAACP